MTGMIKNGVGDCRYAEVDSRHRLSTFSTTLCACDNAMLNERSFVVTSTDITLTSANESAILYLENNEASDLIIDKTIIGIGASTGGSGVPQSVSYTNPSSGTIISEANDAVVGNLDLGSSVTLNANVYVGGEGKTVVGTGLPAGLFVSAPGYDLTLPKSVISQGDSAVLSIIPPTGNTSMVVNITLYVYLKDYA